MKRILILLLMMLYFPLIAQDEHAHETTSQVKELSDYHEVIYQVWHTGWPEKNIALLKSLSPEVEQGYLKIAKAELPGILRDKEDKWNDGLKILSSYVEDYKTASAKNDSISLLNAAEKVHSQYEVLVRIVKPMLKEVDEFHQVLYMLYHYYTPEYNVVKIKETASELESKLANLNNAKLSKRLQPKQEKFDFAKMELEIAVKKLNELLATDGNKKSIDTGVDLVHSKYQELEKVFD